jgi:hypothetical protein
VDLKSDARVFSTKMNSTLSNPVKKYTFQKFMVYFH